jgi:hypothetical protein
VSDRVTWETCPRCGQSAALGWTTIRWITGDPLLELPVEFACPSDCDITEEERRMLGAASDRSPT